MKKVIYGILLLVVIIIGVFFTWYKQNLQMLNDIKSFNNEYEGYLDREISGVDLTTIINKAIENNNKNEIPKNEDGTYKNDGESSIEIIIKPTEEGKAYPMEAFEKVGIREFTKNFGGVVFKSVKVEYHKNGKISKIYFEMQKKNN